MTPHCSVSNEAPVFTLVMGICSWEMLEMHSIVVVTTNDFHLASDHQRLSFQYPSLMADGFWINFDKPLLVDAERTEQGHSGWVLLRKQGRGSHAGKHQLLDDLFQTIYAGRFTQPFPDAENLSGICPTAWQHNGQWQIHGDIPSGS